jgi:hypothetical protein
MTHDSQGRVWSETSNVSNLGVLGVLGVLRCVWFQCWRKHKQDSPAEQLTDGSPIANLVDWKLTHRVFLLRWCCYWIRHMFEASDPNTGQMYINHRKSIKLHPLLVLEMNLTEALCWKSESQRDRDLHPPTQATHPCKADHRAQIDFCLGVNQMHQMHHPNVTLQARHGPGTIDSTSAKAGWGAKSA